MAQKHDSPKQSHRQQKEQEKQQPQQQQHGPNAFLPTADASPPLHTIQHARPPQQRTVSFWPWIPLRYSHFRMLSGVSPACTISSLGSLAALSHAPSLGTTNDARTKNKTKGAVEPADKFPGREIWDG